MILCELPIADEILVVSFDQGDLEYRLKSDNGRDIPAHTIEDAIEMVIPTIPAPDKMTLVIQVASNVRDHLSALRFRNDQAMAPANK